MGGTSEREFLEKITKIKTKSSKRVADVKNDFAKMQKLKTDSLKKTEEMMQTAEHDLEKLEQEILKSKDLVSESRPRLSDEIKAAKEHITQKYDDLKERVLAAIVPE
jgi:DNA repair ATPase RecN